MAKEKETDEDNRTLHERFKRVRAHPGESLFYCFGKFIGIKLDD